MWATWIMLTSLAPSPMLKIIFLASYFIKVVTYKQPILLKHLNWKKITIRSIQQNNFCVVREMKQVCHNKRTSLHRQLLKKLHLHLFIDPHIGMLHLDHIMMLTWAFCNGDTQQHTTTLHIINNLRNVFWSFFGSNAYMKHLPSIINAKSILDAPCSAF
jgi:hypothetical protein